MRSSRPIRRNRGLTPSERWELGLFLSLLIVGCVCLAAVMNVGNMRGLLAAGVQEVDGVQPATTAHQRESAQQIVSWKPAERQASDGLRPVAPVVPAVVSMNVSNKATVEAPKPRKVVAAAPQPEIKWYKGEKYKYVRTLRMRVTAYAPDSRCCWPYPGTTTATGLSVKTNNGRLVAADPRVIPMHSLVSVPGYTGGAAVPVLDTGGAIKGNRLDVMLPTFDAAKEWGSRVLDVKVYAPVD